MKPISFSSTSVQPSDDLYLLQLPKQTLRKAELLREKRVYLDTPDWRLRDAGKWLYRRAEGPSRFLGCAGQDLDAQVASGILPSSEFLWEFPKELAAWLKSTVKMRRLAPRLQLDLKIQVYRLEDKRHKTVSLLHLISGRARMPAVRRGVRLEDRVMAIPLRGYDQAFQELVNQLETSHLFSRSKSSLYPYGLSLLDPGISLEEVRGVAVLQPGTSTTRAIQQILGDLRLVIEEQGEGLLDPEDSEFLHQFRVATRKTRTLLGQSRDIFPKRSLQRFQKFFGWLGKSTGKARDLDVYLLKLEGYGSDWPIRFATHLSELRTHLEASRQAEQEKIVSALGSRRYQDGLLSWQEFLQQEPAQRMPDALTPIEEFATRQILKRFSKIRKRIGQLGPGGPVSDLHRLRIHFKKLRYQLEFFASLFPARPVDRLISAVKKLQDLLGDFNDCSVQAGWLEALAGDFPGTEHEELRNSLALLSRELRRQGATLRANSEDLLRDFISKKNKKTFRRIFKDRN